MAASRRLAPNPRAIDALASLVITLARNGSTIFLCPPIQSSIYHSIIIGLPIQLITDYQIVDVLPSTVFFSLVPSNRFVCERARNYKQFSSSVASRVETVWGFCHVAETRSLITHRIISSTHFVGFIETWSATCHLSPRRLFPPISASFHLELVFD